MELGGIGIDGDDVLANGATPARGKLGHVKSGTIIHSSGSRRNESE